MTSRNVETNFNNRTKNDSLFVVSIFFRLNVLQLVCGAEQRGRENQILKGQARGKEEHKG